MSTVRPFCYNSHTNPTLPGTEQVGDIAAVIGVASIDTSLQWWNGPDEDLGYVIAYTDPTGDHPNGPERVFNTNYVCNLGFLRTGTHSDTEFVELAKKVTGNYTLVTAAQAKTELNNQGYWTSYGAVPTGMSLFLDAGNSNSYPGTGTTWFDLSGNENDGTFAGGVQFGATAGGTMEFDGVDSAITFSNPVEIPVGNDPYTISVWFNSEEMPSNRGFVGWGGFGNINEVNAWRLHDTGVSGFRHYWWGNDLDYTTPMSTGVWYHAVAAYENGSRKLYLNNVEVAEDFPTGHNVTDSTNLRIGVTADFLGEWFWGKIAQVIIYKRQATVAEIDAIWNSGKSRFGY